MKVLTHVNNAWKGLLAYYNEEKVGSYFLRRTFKKEGFKLTKGSVKEEVPMSVIDQYTLILRRAGFLQKVDTGVYKKVKKIPSDLKITAALEMAYPGYKLPRDERKKLRNRPSYDFMRPFEIKNDSLRAVVGADFGTRTEIVKKVWAYIKANGLQDLKNRRNINLDDRLSLAFGFRNLEKQNVVSMFEMTKLITKQLGERKK